MYPMVHFICAHEVWRIEKIDRPSDMLIQEIRELFKNTGRLVLKKNLFFSALARKLIIVCFSPVRFGV